MRELRELKLKTEASCGDRNSFCVTKEKYFVYHVEKTNTS